MGERGKIGKMERRKRGFRFGDQWQRRITVAVVILPGTSGDGARPRMQARGHAREGGGVGEWRAKRPSTRGQQRWLYRDARVRTGGKRWP